MNPFQEQGLRLVRQILCAFQLNIFPIRNWKALEVWLYIYWKGLSYILSMILVLKRIGCWLCPLPCCRILQSKRFTPLKCTRNGILTYWSGQKQEDFRKSSLNMDSGAGRSCLLKYAYWQKNLGFLLLLKENFNNFEIEIVGGISPCRAGGFSIEAGVRGIREKEMQILNVLGNTVYVEEMGILFFKIGTGSVKFFSSGNLLVSSETKEKLSAFLRMSQAIIRFTHCTGCGICIKVCPTGAVSLNERRLCVSEKVY